ncbi:MAG: DsrE family protein [Acetobacteraceae bacterium]|nr:DsrE family protein [Acetobacteraceae bacterium]
MFEPPDPPAMPPLPLGIVLHSGDYSRAHYALMMANAALAMGREVVLFATMAGIGAFTRDGWRTLGGAVADARLSLSGVAGFAELLAAALEMKLRLIVCDAGLKAQGLGEDDLDPALPGEIAGLVTFYEAVGDGSIVFV